MFGTNEVVGTSYFKYAPRDHLMVTSQFYTMQGEGPLRGHPAYFVRLSKCNLRCRFCDSYFDSGEYYHFDYILSKAQQDIELYYKSKKLSFPRQLKTNHTSLRYNIPLVITGGEPTLQSQLTSFIEHAFHYFTQVQIESNGVIALPLNPKTIVVVSPKCVEKNETPLRYLTPNKESLKRANCLKFVMSADTENFAPYTEVPEWALQWAEETLLPIYVSPMNMYKKQPAKSITNTLEDRSTIDETISFWEPGLLDLKQNELNHKYTAQYALNHGLIFNLQTHLYAALP